MWATAAVGLVVLSGLVGCGADPSRQAREQHPGEGEQRKLVEIASACASSVDEKGMGEFVVRSKTLVSNEEGRMEVPCIIKLERGGELVLSRVVLRGKDLHIGEKKPNGQGRVRIENYELYGAEDATFLVLLSDPEDRIGIHGSTLDSPRGLQVQVKAQKANGSASGKGGEINVTGSTLRSAGAQTQGLIFTAGSVSGRTNIVNLELNTVPFDDSDPRFKKTVFMAKDRHKENVRGVPETFECDSDAINQELREAARYAEQRRTGRRGRAMNGRSPRPDTS